MKTINVQLLNPTLNIIIAAVTFTIFLPLFILIFSNYLPSSIGPFITLLASVSISSLIAKYLSKGQSKIQITGDVLTVTVYNEYLNRDYLYVFDKSEVNAFEIYKDKYFTKLVFYRHQTHPREFTLIAKKQYQDELIDFLKEDFRFLDKKTTLSGKPFISAFLAAIINLTAIMTGIIGCYLIINWIYYSATGTVTHINILYWISLTVTFLFLYNKLHYKKNLRISGRNTTWIIILITTTVVYFTLIPASYSIFQKPLKVTGLTDTISDSTHKFLIADNILTDTAQIGYVYKIYNKRRSNVHTVTHFFTTPVLDPQNPGELNHRLFIARSYKQSIPKILNISEKDNLRREFMNKKAAAFKTESAINPTFYEVLHQQQNQSFTNNNFLRSALSTRHVKQPVMIIQGHSESFVKFQESEIKNVMTGFVLVSVALLLAGLVIAFNR